jgi:hypothetical protein
MNHPCPFRVCKFIYVLVLRKTLEKFVSVGWIYWWMSIINMQNSWICINAYSNFDHFPIFNILGYIVRKLSFV